MVKAFLNPRFNSCSIVWLHLVCGCFVLLFQRHTPCVLIDAFTTKSTSITTHNVVVLKTFGFPSVASFSRTSFPFEKLNFSTQNSIISSSTTTSPVTTRLNMYNLPPSGGGGGGPRVGDVVRGALGIALILAFFASPLGGLVFGLFNSLLVLSFVLPLVVSVGYQVWVSLSTISGTCPNCGVPARVIKADKDGIASPSLCFNCGAILQANDDNTGIENITGRRAIDDISPMGGGNSLFDVFTRTTTTTTTTSIDESGKRKKQTTVIDVDVIDDERPFQ